MKTRGLWVAGAVLLLLSVGCMSQMTGMAPSSTPITADDTYTVLGQTSGKAWGVMLFGIPIFEHNPSEKAVQRAIDQGGGNALIEVCQDVNMLYLLYLYLYWTDVEGTAVQVERGGARGR